MLPNKRMQLTKLRAAPVRQAEVPPCAPAGQMDGGTASQLIRSVRRTGGEVSRARPDAARSGRAWRSSRPASPSLPQPDGMASGSVPEAESSARRVAGAQLLCRRGLDGSCRLGATATRSRALPSSSGVDASWRASRTGSFSDVADSLRVRQIAQRGAGRASSAGRPRVARAELTASVQRSRTGQPKPARRSG